MTMKNIFLSMLIAITGFSVIDTCTQEHTIAVPSISISEAEAIELQSLINSNRQLDIPELSENDKLHILSQIRARNTPAYMAREKKREELTSVYNDMQKHQGLCNQPTRLFKHLLNNDYDSLAQELWNKAYHCHMARKAFREYQRKSRQEEKLHAEVLLTPDYKAMKQKKLVIDLPESE